MESAEGGRFGKKPVKTGVTEPIGECEAAHPDHLARAFESVPLQPAGCGNNLPILTANLAEKCLGRLSGPQAQWTE